MSPMHASRASVFASHPDQAIVVRLECDKPGQITFDLSMTSPHAFESQTISSHTLSMTGHLRPREEVRLIGPWDKDGLEVRGAGQSRGRWRNGCGQRRQDLRQGGRRRYDCLRGGNQLRQLPGRQRGSSEEGRRRIWPVLDGKSFEQLYRRHVDDHSKLFGRVAIDLGGKAENGNLPTDQRLQRVVEGRADPLLAEQVFQYGRYLMIAGSRPGTQPLNLQGIWNDKINPPWGSKYTININIQMNYWVAEVCNLSVCHEPLLRMVGELQTPGRNTASVHYRAGGWVAITTRISGAAPHRLTVRSGECGRRGAHGSANIYGSTISIQATSSTSEGRIPSSRAALSSSWMFSWRTRTVT